VHRTDVSSDHPAAVANRGAQLSHFSERIVGRRARSYAERDAIFKLRYQSYLRAKLIAANPFGRYFEPSDHAEGSYLIGLHADRRLVAALRLQIGGAAAPGFPPSELFPEALRTLLRSNKTVVHMSCVATNAESAPSFVWLPYFILRCWIVAAEHFGADYIAAAVRPQHQLFYRRVLGCDLHPQIRPQPRHLAPAGLVTLEFAASAGRLYQNLPFLRSTGPNDCNCLVPRRPPSGASAPEPSVSEGRGTAQIIASLADL
jgi:N-acyl amino acid synthase FeeM